MIIFLWQWDGERLEASTTQHSSEESYHQEVTDFLQEEFGKTLKDVSWWETVGNVSRGALEINHTLLWLYKVKL